MAGGEDIWGVSREFVSIPTFGKPFEFLDVSSKETGGIELPASVNGNSRERYEALYGTPDHMPSTERAPRVGRKEKHPFACAGIRPLNVAANFEIRELSNVGMRPRLPTVTAYGEVKPRVIRHSSCLATASPGWRMISIPSRIERGTHVNALSGRRFENHGTHLRHSQDFSSGVKEPLNCRRCCGCRGIELGIRSTAKPGPQSFHVEYFFHCDSDSLQR